MPVFIKLNGQYIAASGVATEEAALAEFVKKLEFETFTDIAAVERAHPDFKRLDQARILGTLD